MPRKSELPLETKVLRLFEGDVETIQRFYPPGLGYNLVIRTLVHNHAKKLLEREAREGVTNERFASSLSLSDVGDGLDLGAVQPGPGTLD